MIAQGAEGIRHSAHYLRDDLIASVADPFLAGDLRLIAQHFDLVAEDFDRAVDNLVADRAALEAFFAAALPHLCGGGGGDEAAAATAALADTVAGLRVGDLAARGDRDMVAFIAVHARIDRAVAAGEPWAAPLREEAWRILDAWLERRRYRTVG